MPSPTEKHSAITTSSVRISPEESSRAHKGTSIGDLKLSVGLSEQQRTPAAKLPPEPRISIQIDKDSRLATGPNQRVAVQAVNVALEVLTEDLRMKRLLEDPALSLEIALATPKNLATIVSRETSGEQSHTADAKAAGALRAYSSSRREGGRNIHTVLLSESLLENNPALIVSMHHELSHIHLARTGNPRMLTPAAREESVTDTSVKGLRTIQAALSASPEADRKALAGRLEIHIRLEEANLAEWRKVLKAQAR